MTANDAISTINTIADNSCDLKTVAALRAAQTAMKRLAAIRAVHERGAVQTVGGRVVYADIRGRELHELLYGEVE